MMFLELTKPCDKHDLVPMACALRRKGFRTYLRRFVVCGRERFSLCRNFGENDLPFLKRYIVNVPDNKIEEVFWMSDGKKRTA